MLVEFRAAEVYNETRTDPHRNLLMAIIERAINDVFRSSKSASYLDKRRYHFDRLDAIEWIFEDERTGFGFLEICEYLDYSAEAIRVAIKKELE